MGKFTIFITLFAVILMAGCHHEQAAESTSSSASKYDRLVGNENLRLTQELEKSKAVIADLTKQLADSYAKNEETQRQADNATSFLMKELPDTLMQENANLKEQIIQLKTQLQKYVDAENK